MCFTDIESFSGAVIFVKVSTDQEIVLVRESINRDVALNGISVVHVITPADFVIIYRDGNACSIFVNGIDIAQAAGHFYTGCKIFGIAKSEILKHRYLDKTSVELGGKIAFDFVISTCICIQVIISGICNFGITGIKIS